MVNLVVAIIVSDVQELRQDVDIQSLIYKASQIVRFNSVFGLNPNIRASRLPNVIHRIAKAEDLTSNCVHSLCRNCDLIKLNCSTCEKQLINIVQSRMSKQNSFVTNGI